MKENKKTNTFWLEPSLVEEMESMLTEANAISKSDFVRQAIKFYMAFLRQGKSLDFLSPLLVQTIKSEVESVERNLSGVIFKLAVEQGKIANMISYSYNDLTDEYMDELHEECANRVAETNGVITFEDAYDFQHGG
ncbi:MAG: hypothetical protein PHR14_09745 [Oscillospiraceae bacterium]|jgi:hypothetical protein|nr:hypothetical protein [Oscillospiraceae bacterium]